MEESILNDLGFDPVYLLIASAILTLILMVVTILCLINMRKLYRRYDIFMRGKDAESMENMIVDQMNAIIELQSQDRYNKDSIRTANKNSRAAFQKIGIVKYNAFKGMGGNLSFALAMLDYTNTGFVLNSVHSREGCYLYLKDVERGETEVLLGAEESIGAGSWLQGEKARGIKQKTRTEMRVIIRSWSFAFVLIEACSSVAAPSSNMHFVYKYMYEKKIIKIKINILTTI